MNRKAIWGGYVNAMKILGTGAAVLALFTLIRGEKTADAASFVGILCWCSLIAGGLSSGIKAGKRGYLHGAAVACGLWLTRTFLFCWFIPELLDFSDLFFSGIYCLFWGAIGGVGGVNWAILQRQERVRVRG